ncbi:MAG: DUF4124 domain-containing protein [Rhodanobacter sp.]|jgi:hypothetical protein|nr:DUF4124 domain-containing protein [Rhodanobacter sp.]
MALALVLASLGALTPAQAATVYKCHGADGSVAYQDHACAGTQGETRMPLTDAPAYAPPPDYGVAKSSAAPAQARTPRSSTRHRPPAREPISYECRANNGEVFYSHTSCPKSITVKDGSSTAQRGKRAGQRIGVSATALPRSEVCARLAAGGRTGHKLGAQVSSYERNTGRDPCR